MRERLERLWKIAKYCGIEICQNREEMLVLCSQINLVEPRVSTVLEIGVRYGGWMWLVSSIFNQTKHYIGIDIDDVSKRKACVDMGFTMGKDYIHLIQGKSQD